MISTSASLKASLGKHLKLSTRGSLEHRRALCCWIPIVTATPATVAETNLWLSEYNARLTQIGPITLTIRPFAPKQVPLSSNNLKNEGQTDVNENDAVVAMAFKQAVFSSEMIEERDSHTREDIICQQGVKITRGWISCIPLSYHCDLSFSMLSQGVYTNTRTRARTREGYFLAGRRTCVSSFSKNINISGDPKWNISQ